MFKLENKVELIVPNHDNNEVEIADKRIKEAVNKVTKIAGGCTTTDVKGQWWSDDEQRIMQDYNTNFEWYYDKDMEGVLEQQGLIHGLATITRILITEYGQEGISIKINGTLYIIDESDLNFLSYELYKLMF